MLHALHYRFLWESNIIMFMKMLHEKKRLLFSGIKASISKTDILLYLTLNISHYLRHSSFFCLYWVIKPLRVHNLSTVIKHNKILLSVALINIIPLTEEIIIEPSSAIHQNTHKCRHTDIYTFTYTYPHFSFYSQDVYQLVLYMLNKSQLN